MQLATGWKGPGIESRWRRDFPHPFRPALRATQLPIPCVYWVINGVKRPGRGVDHPPHLVLRLKKEYSLQDRLYGVL